MLGLIAALGVGSQVKRLWPGGILFLLILAALEVGFLLLLNFDDAGFSREPAPNFTTEYLLRAYLSNLLIYAIPFLLSWGIARYLRKRRLRRSGAAD